MSRGLGAAQRYILSTLQQSARIWSRTSREDLLVFSVEPGVSLPVQWLASMRTNGVRLHDVGVKHRRGTLGYDVTELPPPSKAQVETLRRAAWGLAAVGLVEVKSNDTVWVTLPEHLWPDDARIYWDEATARRLLLERLRAAPT